MAERKSIHDMALELYQDETLAAAVVADSERLGTVKAIESGKLVLPHPIEATRWLQRKMAEDNRDNRERE